MSKYQEGFDKEVRLHGMEYGIQYLFNQLAEKDKEIEKYRGEQFVDRLELAKLRNINKIALEALNKLSQRNELNLFLAQEALEKIKQIRDSDE